MKNLVKNLVLAVNFFCKKKNKKKNSIIVIWLGYKYTLVMLYRIC